MDRKELKKILAGIGIVSLISGAGLTTGHVKAASG